MKKVVEDLNTNPAETEQPLQVQPRDGRLWPKIPAEQFAGIAEIQARLRSPEFAKIAETVRQGVEAVRSYVDLEKIAETHRVLKYQLFPPSAPVVAVETSSTKRGRPPAWEWQGLISILKREPRQFESMANFEEWILDNVKRADGKLRGNGRPQMKTVRAAIRKHGLDRIAKILKR